MYRKLIITALICTGLVLSAGAELQNVCVGGEIRIMANYVTNWAAQPAPLAPRWAPGLLPKRPIGDFFSGAPANGGAGIWSPYSWDNDMSHGFDFVEQRTKLNVKADFTDGVTAFIELDSYDVWGQDFRSDYITGADFAASSVDDVEIYQAYIEANDMFGLPLRARVGRQELVFGNEWLVGNMDNGPFFIGRSFDGARLTYATDTFSVDAFATILAEGGAAEEDGDVTFYGVYASCTAVENHVFDLYWLYLRDPRSLNDTAFVAPIEWLEDLFGLDDYDATQLHTFGLRAGGAWAGLDYNLEAAYQMGDAGQVGFGFKPGIYGDDDAEYDTWALKADLGYTIDVMWMPRVFAGYSYYGGEDNRDLTVWEWLNPFYTPEASVSFNRLFSDQFYCGFFDLQKNFSNFQTARVGVIAHPLEALDVYFELAYYEALEPFSAPLHVSFGGFRFPVAPNLSFLDQESEDDLGFTTNLVFTYHYSEDVMINLQWAHLFAGDGLDDGNFTAWNGLLFDGGTSADDSDYMSVDMRIKF